ncbi:MAG: TetR/AcrR family transcriptional regulator [Gemmatimonadales bacterium]|jgi:AcrR family transcriptional regulator
MIAGRFPVFWSRLDELVDGGSRLPAWLDDRQARSRATRERILRVAESFVRRGSFDEMSMQELAEEAGVSVGAVYARFPSKATVLELVGLVAFDAARAEFEGALAALPPGAGLGEVIDAYTSTLVRALHEHARVLREIRGNASESSELRSLLRRTNGAIHEAFLGRARAIEGGIRHPDPEKALLYGLFMVNAAAREAVLAGALAPYGLEGDRAELAAELARSFRRYLGIGETG